MTKGKSYQIDYQLFEKAFKAVKANRGAAGTDGTSIAEYEARLEDNLYKLWNRMSSGSYFPKPVKGVEIPKKDGRKRLLGVPTVEDRVAQMVVRMMLEPLVEPVFCADSYGYRPGRSAHDALRVTRERCWRYDWLIEFDIKGLFDNIDHEMLMEAVGRHTDSKWVILYIERWLVAPFQMPDGTLQERSKGTPQGGVISPVLANLFMHYAFDIWMGKRYAGNPWARYADDGVIHCRSREEAEHVLKSLEARMRKCRLEIHPDKTRIVYCKDGTRKGEHEHTEFDFLGFTFRTRVAKSGYGRYFVSFLPAASKKACQSLRDKIRNIRRYSTNISMQELAARINPIIQGWANYYGAFYKSLMKHELKNINLSLARWVMRKYRRFRGKMARALAFLGQCARKSPTLFAHWRMGVIPAM